MRKSHLLLGAALLVLLPAVADSMCCYFRPRVVDIEQPQILQPSQIAFVTWDPESKIETVTVQPRFEGNARDFGMVIPTPSQPKLHEMPRGFFKALEVFTTPKKRVIPESKLLPRLFPPGLGGFGGPRGAPTAQGAGGKVADEPRETTVTVLEVGQVGNLDYKIINAARPDDLINWLKDNKYNFEGDEATLDFYVKKKYFFTVMKIDTLQMKKNKDGSYTGDVTPTRFTFKSEELVYPLKITQPSVKDKTEALFYVQAPFKVDLPGKRSYQYQWASQLQQIQNMMGPGELLKQNQEWLAAVVKNSPDTLKPIQGGMTTLHWAKKLTRADIGVITGDTPYSETVPDPDFGFTQLDMRDFQKSAAIHRVINRRLAEYQKAKPRGYLVRKAKPEDLKELPVLKGLLKEGQYLTKFYREFQRAEMTEDLVMTAAKVGNVADTSEHEEVLRTLDW
ncbi:MAG TPA: DUF2330 domain-containing protein, partial [Gemmataceae bacterium]|nr:DUF2330 domain-containing protein [Gemmataceae bacterium]